MTFEDTDNRASTVSAGETNTSTRRRRPSQDAVPLSSKMLRFVDDAGSLGGRLEGLALLFRSTFLPSDGVPPANWHDAAEIVADCMETMSKVLLDLSVQAHSVHLHETRGGAR